MGLFAIGIKPPLPMTIERLHDPVRASRGAPLRLHSISASIAVCHSGNSDYFFGSFAT
jgi:hypothetical protein